MFTCIPARPAPTSGAGWADSVSWDSRSTQTTGIVRYRTRTDSILLEGNAIAPAEHQISATQAIDQTAESAGLAVQPDAGLAVVIDAWPKLPESLKGAILAIVGTAG